MQFLYPILTLSGLGFTFGLVLAFAARKFYVPVNLRIDRIQRLLPGANCGACGYGSCRVFAEGLVEGRADIDSCRLAQEASREKIAKILGIKLEPKVKLVARLRCGGGKRAKDKFRYSGPQDCWFAQELFGGQKSCIFGCLGFGSCVKSCPFGAIRMGQEELPIIDEARCTGCGRCLESCPKNLFQLVPVEKKIFVRCNSYNLAKAVRNSCPVGCIACRLCEKVCPEDAIRIEDNLAKIDYERCSSCGKCVEVCPQGTILMLEGVKV